MTVTNCWTDQSQTIDVRFSHGSTDQEIKTAGEIMIRFIDFVRQPKTPDTRSDYERYCSPPPPPDPNRVKVSWDEICTMITTFLFFDGVRITNDALWLMVNGECSTIHNLALWLAESTIARHQDMTNEIQSPS